MRAQSLFATGLSGTGVQVQLDDGRLRPVLADGALVMPASMIAQGELARAAVAHAAAHFRYSIAGRPSQDLRPMSVALVSAFEDARVERLLAQGFPAARRWFLAALPPKPEPGDLSFSALLTRMDLLLANPAWQDDNHWVNKARDLFEETVRRTGLENYDAFRAAATILANDLGQMRVRFEPQQYLVSFLYRDDNSYLWDFMEAAQPSSEEVLLRQQREFQEATHKSEDERPAAATAQAEPAFTYPEWDYRLERLRTDWCTVVEKRPETRELRSVGNGFRSRATPLAFRHARRINRARRLRRQWEGEDIDLNAAIESALDRRLGLLPESRMFMRAGKEIGASSVLVLLDLSASTNDCRPGNSGSLLEFEKQAARILTASALRSADRIAVHGFSSNTRNEVSYMRLFEFGERASSASEERIAGVTARYSTRMGAALRHATAQLQSEPTLRRAILIVTDGVPSDIDVHDPRYLIEDARAAVLDAERAGVRSYCLTVDEAGDGYARRIFGWRNYCVATSSERLPTGLQKAYARLVAN